MNFIVKGIFLFLLSFLVTEKTLFAQTEYRLRTKSSSVAWKDDSGKWSKWSDRTESNYLVAINYKKGTISIYSPTLQQYDIISTDKEWKDELGYINQPIKCLDISGRTCTVTEVFINDFLQQLIIAWDGHMLAYTISQD
jgi:hypothetical protein